MRSAGRRCWILRACLSGRLKQPEEVGTLAAMLCAPQVHYLSGTVVDMDGGGGWLRG